VLHHFKWGARAWNSVKRTYPCVAEPGPERVALLNMGRDDWPYACTPASALSMPTCPAVRPFVSTHQARKLLFFCQRTPKLARLHTDFSHAQVRLRRRQLDPEARAREAQLDRQAKARVVVVGATMQMHVSGTGLHAGTFERRPDRALVGNAIASYVACLQAESALITCLCVTQHHLCVAMALPVCVGWLCRRC
jgi:hypothetical protein